MNPTGITIVDYGLGNLFNIQRAIHRVGGKSFISNDPDRIRSSSKVLLPGVGAFGAGVKELRSKNLWDALVEFKNSGRPLFGVCLGMQLLLSSSSEDGPQQGFGFIPGSVVRFTPHREEEVRLKVPHISWNSLRQSPDDKEDKWRGTILEGIPEGAYFYFVHSYYARPSQPEMILAETSYGNRFASVVQFENVSGCQFHPEMSGRHGLRVYQNFVRRG